VHCPRVKVRSLISRGRRYILDNRKTMKRFGALSSIFLLLLLPAGPALGAADPESLWNEAVAKRTAAERMAPRILRLAQEELDSSGVVKSVEHAVIGLSYGEDGKVRLEVSSSEKNGADFSTERKRRLASTAARWADLRGDTTPFDRELQVRLRRGEPRREREGTTALFSFPFELPLDAITMRGRARVTEAAGAPFDVSYTLDPLPTFVDILELGIKFKQVRDEGYNAESVSYLFKASFLFFTWRGRGVLSFEDWTELPVKPRLAE